MRHLLLLITLIISFSSCKSSKITTQKKESALNKNTSSNNKPKIDNIVSYAMQFKNVKYKTGGTTKAGMDCSGLIFKSFKHHNVLLPRISRDMAKKGSRISINKAKKGDLLFFKTSKTKNRINHVGLVIKSELGLIKFIHATTSRGVIISKFSENYWKSAFVEARKIL